MCFFLSVSLFSGGFIVEKNFVFDSVGTYIVKEAP